MPVFINSYEYEQSLDISTHGTNPASVFFSSNGLNVYTVLQSNHKVVRYSLSTAWDISTASYVSEKSVSTETSASRGLSFSASGLKMYINDVTHDKILYYSLSTPWDITTASYVTYFDYSATLSSAASLFFATDGNNFYIVNALTLQLAQFSLSTPWDITTASYVTSVGIAGSPYGVFAVGFTNDGLTFCTSQLTQDVIFQYNLLVPWDISTAGLVESKNVTTNSGDPHGIFFATDLSSLYFSSYDDETITQYNLRTAIVDFELEVYTPPTGDFVNFEFLPVTTSPFLLGFGISGKLGNPSSPDPLNVMGIYQMRMTKQGKKPVKMKFYTPTNPQTAPQQANRAKFAAAMAAWGALSSGDKGVYNERAKKRNMFGWGLFIREYYQAN